MAGFRRRRKQAMRDMGMTSSDAKGVSLGEMRDGGGGDGRDRRRGKRSLAQKCETYNERSRRAKKAWETRRRRSAGGQSFQMAGPSVPGGRDFFDGNLGRGRGRGRDHEDDLLLADDEGRDRRRRSSRSSSRSSKRSSRGTRKRTSRGKRTTRAGARKKRSTRGRRDERTVKKSGSSSSGSRDGRSGSRKRRGSMSKRRSARGRKKRSSGRSRRR